MALFGASDFRGGVTLTKRPKPGDAFMETISGWDTAKGYLEPENVVAKLNTGDALAGTPPAQALFPFIRDSGVGRIACLDANRNVRALVGSLFSDPESDHVINMPADSRPCRVGEQLIVFPTTDGMMAYEPHSLEDKVRPASFKAPTDYDDDATVVVTPSANLGVRLWDCDYATAPATTFTASGAGVTCATVGDYATIAFGATAVAGTAKATKSLGDTGVALTAKRYLVVDITLSGGDPQDYADRMGMFQNDQNQSPSGYEIGLYTDTACTALIRTCVIPRIAAGGSRDRIWLDLGGATGTVKGVALLTSAYWTPPPIGETFTITLYSDVWHDEWDGDGGNFLMPAVAYSASPWAAKLGVTWVTAGSRRIRLTGPVIPGTTITGGGTIAQPIVTWVRRRIVMGGWTWVPQVSLVGGDSPVPAQIQGGGHLDPQVPLMRYCYTFIGRDLLSTDDYHIMSSNKSADCTELASDPWRTYVLSITLPGDIGEQAPEDYGSYLLHVAIYRQIWDATTQTWGDYEFIQLVDLDDLAYTDDADDGDPETATGYPVPEILELANDYASTAKFVVSSLGRLVGLCLDHDGMRWRRPLTMQFSGYEKHWAFPTTTDENSTEADGIEYVIPAQEGGEIRGALARHDDILVFLDSEVFAVAGDNPMSGYRSTRLATRGCKDNRTIADCGGPVIWCDGEEWYVLDGLGTRNISQGRVDGRLVDWGSWCGAAYWRDKYLFACKYDNAWSILAFDLVHGGWRVRSTDSYELRGLCAAAGIVYGLTPDGEMVSLFGSATADYGAAATEREATTQFVPLRPPVSDAQGHEIILLAESDDPNGVTVPIVLNTQGLKNETQTVEFTVKRGFTRYHRRVNLMGDALQMSLAYTGENPPTIYDFYPNPDPKAPR